MTTDDRVEIVARALWEADPLVRSEPWQDGNETAKRLYRHLAAAAIAEMPPSPAEEAVKRVEALCSQVVAWALSPNAVVTVSAIRAALAPPPGVLPGVLPEAMGTPGDD